MTLMDLAAGFEAAEGPWEVWTKAGRFIGNTASELSGMALTSNLGELGDIARAGQYSAGLRMIDQAMLSYGGPGFRSFQYNFSS